VRLFFYHKIGSLEFVGTEMNLDKVAAVLTVLFEFAAVGVYYSDLVALNFLRNWP